MSTKHDTKAAKRGQLIETAKVLAKEVEDLLKATDAIVRDNSPAVKAVRGKAMNDAGAVYDFDIILGRNPLNPEILSITFQKVMERAIRHDVQNFRLRIQPAHWEAVFKWAKSHLKSLGHGRFQADDKIVILEHQETSEKCLARQVEKARIDLEKMPPERRAEVRLALRGMGNVAA